jgi:putative membrane fusion protein
MAEASSTKRNRKQQNKKLLFLSRLIFIFVVIWFLGSSIYSLILGLMVDTKVVEESVIEKKYLVDAYILRDEVVIYAPATGRILNKAQSGARLGFEQPVFQIETSVGTALQVGNPVTVTAPIAGVVSYISDGLEDIFRPEEFPSLDMDKIGKLKIEIIDNSNIDVVEKGKRFCKIINNLEGLQLYLEVPLDIFDEPLQKNQELNLFFPDLNKKARGSIVNLKGVTNTAQILIKLPEAWYSLLNSRTQKVEIILEEKRGVVLPQKAVIINDKQETGVYGLRKGFVYWKPVKIIHHEGNNILVDGIEQYAEVILNPGLVKEGQYLH